MTDTRNNYVPTTISAEAQKALAEIYKEKAYARVFPAPDDLDGWAKTRADGEKNAEASAKQAVALNHVTYTDATMGGVPVLDIRPAGWTDNGKVLVYIHGGAFTMFSAHSMLRSSAPMSRSTGLRVISVTYTDAPQANWKQIQDQVIAVFDDLLGQGFTMNDIALYGDSAGGGLVVSTVFNLRDSGRGMPAVAVLMSPWSDISHAGDTEGTLADTDPLLNWDNMLKPSAEAYAAGVDLTDPRVSPLYGDFSKGFSPALITDGTKCIFLSSSVRLYHALVAAGQEVQLEIYEGMWHVFQTTPMPESEAAFRTSSEFIRLHLGLADE